MSEGTIWKSIGRAALAVLTVGATTKLEDLRQSAEKANENYRNTHEKCCQLQKQVSDLALSRGAANREAHSRLKEAIALLNKMEGGNEVKVSNQTNQRSPEIAKMQKTVVDFNVALDFVYSSGVGVTGAAAAWAAVSTFGVASTGTAIGALSGAAASHAALAWFGGGALSVGGGGMIAGAFVLGGIALFPLIGVGAWLAHSKANKMIAEVSPQIELMKAETLKLDEIRRELKGECERVASINARTQNLQTRLANTMGYLLTYVESLKVIGVALADVMNEPGFKFSKTQPEA